MLGSGQTLRLLASLSLVVILDVIRLTNCIDLNLDNQLVVIANDCYTRVTIGSRLMPADVFSTRTVESTLDCENECSKQRATCNSYSFGIGLTGNGTCELGRKAIVEPGNDLREDADFDVYVRTENDNCEPERLYKMRGNSSSRDNSSSTTTTTASMTFDAKSIFGLTRPPFLQSSRTPRIQGDNGGSPWVFGVNDERRVDDIVRNKLPPQNDSPYSVDYENKGTDHEKIPGWLLERNPEMYFEPEKPQGQYDYSPEVSTGYNSHQEHEVNRQLAYDSYGRPIYPYGNFANAPPVKVQSAVIGITEPRPKNRLLHYDSPFTYKLLQDLQQKIMSCQRHHEPFHHPYWKNRKQGFVSENDKYDSSYYNAGNNDMTEIQRQFQLLLSNYQNSLRASGFSGPDSLNSSRSVNRFRDFRDYGFQDNGQPINAYNSNKLKPCYRKVFNGKKVSNAHVRRALECEAIVDCRRECDVEKAFRCEGFNYRPMGSNAVSRGLCELTSAALDRMDMHRDFINDPRYDYYEKSDDCMRGDDRRITNRPSNWWSSGYQDNPSGPYAISTPNFGIHGSYLPSNKYPIAPKPEARPFMASIDPYRGNEEQQQQMRPIPPPIYQNFGYPPPAYYSPPTGRSSAKGDGSRLYSYETSYPGQGRSLGNRHGRVYNPKYSERRLDYLPPNDVEHDAGSHSYHNTGYGLEPVSTVSPASGGDSYGANIRNTPECSVRSGAGFKITSHLVKRTYLAPNIDSCEKFCTEEVKEFKCLAFSFRYNVDTTNPTDNCLLSEISYDELNFYTDLEPDRDYDIYAMIGDSKICGSRKMESSHPPDECFWRIRSGFGMPKDIVKKSFILDGIGDCQIECVQATDFTCRSFVFRYAPDRNEANCMLSDWPTQEIDPSSFVDIDDAEMYERGSYGRGCEPYPYPLLIPTKQISNGDSRNQGDRVCYAEYNKPCKLTPFAVLTSVNVETESECRSKCSTMRAKDAVPCMSFSFRVKEQDTQGADNCLLSDVPRKDLKPGLDFVYDKHHTLHAWKELEPQCVSYTTDRGSGGNPAVTGGGDDEYEQDGRKYGLYKPNYQVQSRPPGGMPPPHKRPSSEIVIQEFIPFNQNRPSGDDSFQPVENEYPGSGGFDTAAGDKYLPPSNPNSGGWSAGDTGNRFTYPVELATFQHYTVSGYPCKRGTKCARNAITQFWSCEPEGGEVGAWDYCCEPTHHCGYSHGHRYPWCYVGPDVTQWRPCSERYFPYMPSPRPTRPTSNDDSDYILDLPNFGGRHWPVAYLHAEAPPNATEEDDVGSSTSMHSALRSSHRDRGEAEARKLREARLQNRSGRLLARNDEFYDDERPILTRFIDRLYELNKDDSNQVKRISPSSTSRRRPKITGRAIIERLTNSNNHSNRTTMDEMPLSSYDSTIEQVKRRDSNVTDSIGDNTKYFRIPTISATANVSDLFKV